MPGTPNISWIEQQQLIELFEIFKCEKRYAVYYGIYGILPVTIADKFFYSCSEPFNFTTSNQIVKSRYTPHRPDIIPTL
jgi:hypothetical protein